MGGRGNNFSLKLGKTNALVFTILVKFLGREHTSLGEVDYDLFVKEQFEMHSAY